jgi:hypothetical protein
MGLDRHAHDDVASERRRLGDRELGRRPRDLALRVRARLEADVGPGKAEVVELLGVDLGELLGPERRAKVAHRGRRRLGRIVPAAERHDQDRPAEALRTRVDRQGVHPTSSSSSLSRLRSSVHMTHMTFSSTL